MARKAKIERKTTETEIALDLFLDGSGKGTISTSIPFLDHMLNLFSRHGLFDLTVRGKGDRDIDDHHLVEDLGICLGEALKQALGDKRGLERFGEATVPMDESLCRVVLDLSGRPFLVFLADFSDSRIGDFDPALIREFFKAFTDHSGTTLHIQVIHGGNSHHMAEAIFKALARALKKAVTINERIQGIPSTKGSL
ncbi:MAG: imidazoleglycerol-phosphate dehydratase HisB [Deltaproteobacteria bacterium HGW-Deltaproteobacteria-19]|jgi:imidazoleglycerol-phosphate dehydratase|nr:MAG: imidazoleglycerol-phosphate dehydratase HisB [Deltaproteobacteria bacterium HGW-Deltaproteobacteria-19]